MDTIRELLRRHEDAFRQRNAKGLADNYALDAVASSPMFPRAQGRAAIEQSFTSLFRIFPDWDMTFEEPCITDNRAMQMCKVRATQQAEFMGLPSIGRRVEFDCVLNFEIEDGLIARERRIYDFTGLLIQLGVLRGKPAN
jgi:steroid delta-isomerase-like uncharacterized protein